MKTFFIAPLAIFMIMIVVLLAKLLDKNPEIAALVGQPIPAFDLPVALDAVPGLKNTEIKGQYSILNIFASWCVTCKIEHQFLMKLQQDGIPIYGINWKDNPDNLRIWLKQKGNPYKAIGADKEGVAIIALGVTGAPESFLISPEGIILYRYAGVLSQEIWDTKILPIMGQKQ